MTQFLFRFLKRIESRQILNFTHFRMKRFTIVSISVHFFKIRFIRISFIIRNIIINSILFFGLLFAVICLKIYKDTVRDIVG